jgi:uncharacterized lipoprotein NlpE involved in copper resistance
MPQQIKPTIIQPMIKIVDDLVNQPDNLQVDISTAVPQTFQTLDTDGNPQEVTLNVVVPQASTTLGDLKKDLSNKEEALNNAQNALTAAQKAYNDQIVLIDQIQGQADALPARQNTADPAVTADPVVQTSLPDESQAINN